MIGGEKVGKKVKSGLAALLIIVLMFSLGQQVFAAKFKDITTFKEEIEFLTSLKIINGYPDGTYRPDAPILRVQAVMMIMRDLGMETEESPNPGYKDIKRGDMGYAEVAAATELGIISGKGHNKFDPNGHMTRGEMSKVLVNAYGLGGMYPAGFSDVKSSLWSEPFISALAANNVTNGYPDGTFRPEVTINRGQFAAFMARILEPKFKPYSTTVADTLLEDAIDVEVLDVVKHPVKPVLYMIDGLTNSLVSFNYETYETSDVKMPYRAERLAFANGKVYVTQHKMEHDYSTSGAPETGAYAIYDAQSLKLIKLWHLDLDPFDIEANDQGQVFISGGSNQHTSIVSYDSITGGTLSKQLIYMKTLIVLAPDQKKIISLTTSGSPVLISSFPIIGGKLQPEIRSPYHGTYPLNEHMAITPDNKYILNGSGNMFGVNTMEYKGKTDRKFTSSTVDTDYGELYTANSTKLIQAYNFPSLESVYQITTYGDVQHLFYDAQADVLLALTKVKFGKSTYSYVGVEKIYFEAESD